MTLFGALVWGIKTLPAERWQMIAAVPMAKNGNGEWQGLNLTFYGFFSATASTFGVALMIVLLSSIGTSLLTAAAVIATMMAICVPASKVLARVIEGKRNTFTIAGAAFVASLILPPGMVLVQRGLWRVVQHQDLRVAGAGGGRNCVRAVRGDRQDGVPELRLLLWQAAERSESAAGADVFTLSAGVPWQHQESGVRLRTGGRTTDSGADDYLAGVYAVWTGGLGILSSWTLAAGGTCASVGDMELEGAIGMFARRLSRKFADFRVSGMALIAMGYLTLTLSIIPGDGLTPNLMAGLVQVTSASVIVPLQLLWMGLFLYYGRSRVTGSVVSFHVVAERV